MRLAWLKGALLGLAIVGLACPPALSLSMTYRDRNGQTVRVDGIKSIQMGAPRLWRCANSLGAGCNVSCGVEGYFPDVATVTMAVTTITMHDGSERLYEDLRISRPLGESVARRIQAATGCVMHGLEPARAEVI